jgi:hypothetical protein
VTHCDIGILSYIEKMFCKCLYMKSIRLSGTRAEVIIMACARLTFTVAIRISDRGNNSLDLIECRSVTTEKENKTRTQTKKEIAKNRAFVRESSRERLIDTTTRAKDNKNGQFHSYRPDNFYSTSDISPRGRPLPPTSRLPENSLFPSLSVLLILKGIFLTECQAQ